MSEMETHKGKLVPMVLEGVTLEDRCKSACEKLGIENEIGFESWFELLSDEGYKKVYINKEARVIYEIQDKEVDSYGFVEGNMHPDGTIDYFISWYNGGASMDEVLDDVMKKVNK